MKVNILISSNLLSRSKLSTVVLALNGKGVYVLGSDKNLYKYKGLLSYGNMVNTI